MLSESDRDRIQLREDIETLESIVFRNQILADCAKELYKKYTMGYFLNREIAQHASDCLRLSAAGNVTANVEDWLKREARLLLVELQLYYTFFAHSLDNM